MISGVANGHMGHQDAGDIVPPFSYKGASLSQNWDAVGRGCPGVDRGRLFSVEEIRASAARVHTQ